MCVCIGIALTMWLVLRCRYGGRPHWGKNFDRTFTHPRCGLRKVYPQLDTAVRTAARYDPQGMFRPALFDKVRGGYVCDWEGGNARLCNVTQSLDCSECRWAPKGLQVLFRSHPTLYSCQGAAWSCCGACVRLTLLILLAGAQVVRGESYRLFPRCAVDQSCYCQRDEHCWRGLSCVPAASFPQYRICKYVQPKPKPAAPRRVQPKPAGRPAAKATAAPLVLPGVRRAGARP